MLLNRGVGARYIDSALLISHVVSAHPFSTV